MGTPQSQLSKQPSVKKTTTYQKTSSITKDTNKEPHKVGRRIYIIKSHNPGWVTPPKHYIAEAFQRSEKSEPHIRLPSSGIMHQENEPSEHFALKARRACFLGTQSLEGSRDFTLKGCTEKLTCFRNQDKSSNLRGT